jgi:soluble lytic murein transglycosylase-like protein
MSPRIRLFTDEPALGLRGAEERREGHDRRARERLATDRRRERRRLRFRSVLFSVLTLALPTSSKLSPFKHVVRPTVSTAVTSFDPVPPERAYDHLIREASAAYDVDAALIRSVIQTESAFDAMAVSRAGAAGLMQLMPAVAEKLGVTDRFDPRDNIMGGARLLRELLDRYHGNLPLVLAGYNAGAAAVARFGAVPPFPETRHYVKRVTRLIKADTSGGD